MRILLILLLAFVNVCLRTYLLENPDFYQLHAYTAEEEAFRAMNLGEAVAALDGLDMDGLTASMIRWEYDMRDAGEDDARSAAAGEGGAADPDVFLLLQRRPAEYRKLRGVYTSIFQDLRFFPVPESIRAGTPDVTFENGWMDRRTYGGDRGHEGCDIMGENLERGSYPVVSISDGVVEKAGWLEQGGWRLGIRSPSGLYLYYAHLYGYSREWKEGDSVSAGELLGFMGDSGYSAVPGTTGNFSVHLHIGLYLRTDHYDELSINPYWILRYLEKYRLKYDF